MAEAFRGSPLHTTLYHPAGTFPEFSKLDVRTSSLNNVAIFRSRHRLSMPLLARTISRMRVEADVLLTSSSGWAHGLQTNGRKVVYCHTPARWLYQREHYLGLNGRSRLSDRLRRTPAMAALGLLSAALRAWDRRAALTAHRYLANSSVTRDAIQAVYGIQAEVVPPPPALLPDGPEKAVRDIDPGFVLCVARLLPYKNVDLVIDAVKQVPGMRLVVVGAGPEYSRLTALIDKNSRIRLLGRVGDTELRWLYRHCGALVAASYEDYGLSPLEAAAFGRPSIVLRAGGYLDTVVDGKTGVFFDHPNVEEIAQALDSARRRDWLSDVLRAHSAIFSVDRFQSRLREIVSEERNRSV
ncbi:MAG: glycosyltransferase [Mycobacterium sp.]|nr:glycosyltransferase [Mycobacterium sp.]